MRTGAKGRCLRDVTKRVILLVFGLTLLWSSVASGELYMKFAEIDGEAADEPGVSNHEDWSHALTVDWDLSMTRDGDKKSNGKPVLSDLSWTGVMDRSFPPLFQKISQGQYIPFAMVDYTEDFTNYRNVTYFHIEFGNVLLTNLGIHGDPNELPIVSGSFAYDNIYMSYIYRDLSGKPIGLYEASYNLKTGEGSLGELATLYAMGLSGPSVTHTPIPASLLLLGSGLLGLAGVGWRRKRS